MIYNTYEERENIYSLLKLANVSAKVDLGFVAFLEESTKTKLRQKHEDFEESFEKFKKMLCPFYGYDFRGVKEGMSSFQEKLSNAILAHKEVMEKVADPYILGGTWPYYGHVDDAHRFFLEITRLCLKLASKTEQENEKIPGYVTQSQSRS